MMPNFKTTWMKDIRGKSSKHTFMSSTNEGKPPMAMNVKNAATKNMQPDLACKIHKDQMTLSSNRHFAISQNHMNPSPCLHRWHVTHDPVKHIRDILVSDQLQDHGKSDAAHYMTDSQWVWILLFNIRLELTCVWPLPPTSETWHTIQGNKMHS